MIRRFLNDLAALPHDLKLLAVSVFLWGAGDSLFIYIVPLYLKQLGALPSQIGLIYGLAAAVIGLATIPAGILSDRWGRKQVMLLSWCGGLAACGFMAAADNLVWFAAGWIAYWFTAFALPAFSSYVVDGRGTLTAEQALTTVFAAFTLGTIVSPALGGWLGAMFGLRLLFVLGAVLIGLSMLVMTFIRRQPVVPATQGAGFQGLLANGRFVGFCALIAGTWFVMWLGMPLAANFLADVRGMTVAQVGLLGSFDALGSTTIALILGRRPPRRGFLAAQALVGIYLVVLLLTSSIGWIALAFFLRSAGFVARTLAEAIATRLVERAQWGRAFGLIETVAASGTVLAPLVAGRLYEIRAALPFQLSLILLPATILAGYFFVPRIGAAPGYAPAGALEAQAEEAAAETE